MQNCPKSKPHHVLVNNQVRMQNGSGTGGRRDAAAYALDRRYMCTHQVAPLFCTKWRHRLFVRENSDIPSIDAYLLDEHPSCHSDPIWNDGA